MPSRISRRTMLRNTASAGAGLWLAAKGEKGTGSEPPDVPVPFVRLASTGRESPSEKLNIAVIGCGGQGGENLNAVAALNQNLVALCDVDEARAAAAFKRFPKAKKFRDFRQMFDQVQHQIDAVVVSIPDHMHAPVSLTAMRLGKHVYCEKPLTWCIAETRLMAETAKKHKVATQMGTQGMAGDGSRAGVELVRSGVLGPIRQLHVWTDRAKKWWPQGVDRPRDAPPVPKGLDWDLWLGVAPQRPYHPDYVPFKWRGWKDFGTGPLGDMGIHNAAMPFVGLRLGPPSSAEIVECSGLKDETFPAWSILRYQFPAAGKGDWLRVPEVPVPFSGSERPAGGSAQKVPVPFSGHDSGAQPPLVLHWYDGGKKPPADLIGGRKVDENGAILVGDKGTLYSIEWTGGDWRLLPEEKFRDFKKPEPTEPRSPGHHAEWIRACKGGPPAYCNFIDFAAPITELMLVGVLALRTGKKIEWDSASMRAPNCPEADRFIRRQYRTGWA